MNSARAMQGRASVLELADQAAKVEALHALATADQLADHDRVQLAMNVGKHRRIGAVAHQ